MNKYAQLLEQGKEYASYAALCRLFGEASHKGKCKEKHINDWERYFSYHKQGRKWIIDKIYKEPKPKVETKHLMPNELNVDWKAIYEEEYVKNHHGCPYIGDMLGCASTTVHKHFVDLGLKIRDNYEKNKKFSANYNYFDKIDTEDKAYFLGYIYADGFVTENSFGMSLKDCDVEVLQSLLKCMDSDVPIHYYQNKTGYNGTYKPCRYCRVMITNPHLVNSLIKDGVVRHKTTILKPPTCVPDHLMRHFIRGYTDGDGTLNKTGDQCRIGWVGTKEFVGWIGEYLKSKGIIDRYGFSRQTHSDKVVSVRFGGSTKPLSVMYYLYEGANYYLSRKYNRYKEYMEWKKPNLSQAVLDSIKE